MNQSKEETGTIPVKDAECVTKRRLKKWIHRDGFRVRKMLILKWIFLGNVITMAYKSTLLSSLIQIRYETPIDTLSDLEKSGLQVLIPDGSPLVEAFSTDPRESMKKISNRINTYPYNGKVPPYVIKM